MSDTSITVRGHISNEIGEPVIATVSIKGTGRSVTSDAAGDFEIHKVPKNAVLVFTASNIQQKEVSAGGNSYLSVVVNKMISPLDRVQVIAYGTTTKRMNTGNVGTIADTDIARQPVTNPLSAISGRVAGVVVAQNDGIAGGSFDVIIRGKSSLTQSFRPLYIIDGVPFSNEASGESPLLIVH